MHCSAMARLVCGSTAVGLPRLSPCSAHFHSRSVNLSVCLQNLNRRHLRILCQTNPNPAKFDTSEEKQLVELESELTGSALDSTVSTERTQFTAPSFPEYPDKRVNRLVAVVSTLAAVGLFFSGRLDFGVSLKDLSAAAMPYEEALSNGKPTVVEFYADWCKVCRELAPEVYKVEQQYKDRVNFVLLNVDNTKWEQEVDEFGVEGIPHFAFLDRDGNEEGNIEGRLPRQYLFENVDALARGEATVPYAHAVGQYSSAEARKFHQVSNPRSHG